jgi:hypothetical protein
MATVAGVFNMVHTPFCYIPADRWGEVRAKRRLREDVPEDGAEAESKSRRIHDAFDILRLKLAESRPDVIVMFGDDQREYLDFYAYPQFAIYADEEFTGALSADDLVRYNITREDGHQAPRKVVKGYPALAGALLSGLQQYGFDPAFCLKTEKTPEVGHAFMRPAESLTDFGVPIVPIMTNCYFAPQVTGRRSYQLGAAVRRVVDAYPEDLRVAFLGSGGLWHTPGAQEAYLNEDFDLSSLRFLEEGDPCGAAEFFDSYRVPEGDLSQPVHERNRTATGLPPSCGPQGGTREFCNWIAAAATVEGKPAKIIDYVPVYSSPVGAGFAYYPEV